MDLSENHFLINTSLQVYAKLNYPVTPSLEIGCPFAPKYSIIFFGLLRLKVEIDWNRQLAEASLRMRG
jgi:hypothetical protein